MHQHTEPKLGNRRKIKAYLPLGLWTVAIMLGSLWPVEHLPKVATQISDKLEHVFAYAVLAFLILRSQEITGRLSNKTGRWFILIFVFTSFYGFLLEVLQGTMLFNRSFEYLDILANSGGSIIGFMIGWFYLAFKRSS